MSAEVVEEGESSEEHCLDKAARVYVYVLPSDAQVKELGVEREERERRWGGLSG